MCPPRLQSSQASSGGGFFRKTQSEKRLLGISDKQMILMDGRTKVLTDPITCIITMQFSVPVLYHILVEVGWD